LAACAQGNPPRGRMASWRTDTAATMVIGSSKKIGSASAAGGWRTKRRTSPPPTREYRTRPHSLRPSCSCPAAEIRDHHGLRRRFRRGYRLGRRGMPGPPGLDLRAVRRMRGLAGCGVLAAGTAGNSAWTASPIRRRCAAKAASVRPPERLRPRAGADPSPLLSLVQPHPSPCLYQRCLDCRVGVL
jgi:hypothetical protein